MVVHVDGCPVDGCPLTLRRIRLYGIITSLYPEATLITFSFPVGANSPVWHAFLWPRLLKVVLLGGKNAFIWPKIHQFETTLKDAVIIMIAHHWTEQGLSIYLSMRIRYASMRISKNWCMANPSIDAATNVSLELR